MAEVFRETAEVYFFKHFHFFLAQIHSMAFWFADFNTAS